MPIHPNRWTWFWATSHLRTQISMNDSKLKYMSLIIIPHLYFEDSAGEVGRISRSCESWFLGTTVTSMLCQYWARCHGAASVPLIGSPILRGWICLHWSNLATSLYPYKKSTLQNAWVRSFIPQNWWPSRRVPLSLESFILKLGSKVRRCSTSGSPIWMDWHRSHSGPNVKG